MKGGVITESEEFEGIFNYLTRKNIMTKVSKIGVKSIGGEVFIIDFKPTRQLMTVSIGEKDLNSFINTTKQVLVKFVYIGNTNSRTTDRKIITIERDFLLESEIQTAVYTQSMDLWCDPICPKILDFKILNKNHVDAIKFIDTIGKKVNISNIRTNIGNPSITRVGLIFMELLTGTKPVATLFPSWKDTQPVVASLNSLQNAVLANYTIQLVRLRKLGIKHNDTHLENAMFKEYNYVMNYKVWLIDFGKSIRVSTSSSLNLYHVNEIFLSTSYWSYQQLIHYARQTSTNDSLDIWWGTTVNAEITASRREILNKLYYFDRIGTITIKLDEAYFHQLSLELNDMFIFKTNNIDLKVFTSVPDINSVFLRLSIVNVNGTNIYVGIDEKYENYSLSTYETMVQLKDSIKYYMNDEFLTGGNGLYLWVIGTIANVCSLYVVKVQNPFMFCTTHALLMRHFDLMSCYCFGEFFLNQNVLNINFYSKDLDMNAFYGGINYDELVASLDIYISYKLNYSRFTKNFVRERETFLVPGSVSFENELNSYTTVNNHFQAVRGEKVFRFYLTEQDYHAGLNEIDIVENPSGETPPQIVVHALRPESSPLKQNQGAVANEEVANEEVANEAVADEEVATERWPSGSSLVSFDDEAFGATPSPIETVENKSRTSPFSSGGNGKHGKSEYELESDEENDFLEPIESEPNYLTEQPSITENTLSFSDIDIAFFKEIVSIEDVNLKKNIQKLNVYAIVSCKNAYNALINITSLLNSEIKAEIITIHFENTTEKEPIKEPVSKKVAVEDYTSKTIEEPWKRSGILQEDILTMGGRKSTKKSTKKSTRKSIRKSTRKSTKKSTKKSRRKSTRKSTKK